MHSYKLIRGENDPPFHQLSPATLKSLDRGWLRYASRPYTTRHGFKYYLQCTTWKDKKQVTFLHTHLVCGRGGETVERHEKGKRQRVEFDCHPISQDYSKYYNGVDHNDRDSADYTTSLKTNRWYLRIFFWILDRVIFAVFLSVSAMADCGARPDWERYSKKNNGRYEFQIDLAMQLMEEGIRRDWPAPFDDDTKPEWIRQKTFLPCECKCCFFCKVGKTSAPIHKSALVASGTHAAVWPPVERIVPLQCSLDRQTMTQGGGRHCRMCYAESRLREGPDVPKSIVRAACHSTRKGCPNCKAFICSNCWPEFDHNLG